MPVINKIFLGINVFCFALILLSYTLFQYIPIEFADWRVMHNYYDGILYLIPISILFSLTWTIALSKSNKSRIAVVVATILLTVLAYFLSWLLIFSYGFGAWVDIETVYEHKSNSNVVIKEQIYDIGAFGYGGQRVVKITPFLHYWNIVEYIDTSKIDKTKWKSVDREGDVTFP